MAEIDRVGHTQAIDNSRPQSNRSVCGGEQGNDEERKIEGRCDIRPLIDDAAAERFVRPANMQRWNQSQPGPIDFGRLGIRIHSRAIATEREREMRSSVVGRPRGALLHETPWPVGTRHDPTSQGGRLREQNLVASSDALAGTKGAGLGGWWRGGRADTPQSYGVAPVGLRVSAAGCGRLLDERQHCNRQSRRGLPWEMAWRPRRTHRPAGLIKWGACRVNV
jgi:hypothetical protein